MAKGLTSRKEQVGQVIIKREKVGKQKYSQHEMGSRYMPSNYVIDE